MPKGACDEISFSESIDVTCPHCQQVYSKDIWSIVDSARHDLIEQLYKDELNRSICPHCGAELITDVPLFLITEYDEIRLIFSPASESTYEQDIQEIARLRTLLREHVDTTEEVRILHRSSENNESDEGFFIVERIAFRLEDLKEESKLLSVPRPHLLTILNGLAYVEQAKRHAAIEDRKALERLTSKERARKIIETAIDDRTYALKSADLNLTFYAVLSEMRAAATQGDIGVKLFKLSLELGRASINKPPQRFGDAVRDYIAALGVSIDRIAPFTGKHPEQLRRLGKDGKHHTLKPEAIDQLIEAADLVGKSLLTREKELWTQYLKVSSLYTLLIVAAHNRTNSSWPDTTEDYDFIWKIAHDLVVRSQGRLYQGTVDTYQTRDVRGFSTDSFAIWKEWLDQRVETEEDLLAVLSDQDMTWDILERMVRDGTFQAKLEKGEVEAEIAEEKARLRSLGEPKISTGS